MPGEETSSGRSPMCSSTSSNRIKSKGEWAGSKGRRADQHECGVATARSARRRSVGFDALDMAELLQRVEEQPRATPDIEDPRAGRAREQRSNPSSRISSRTRHHQWLRYRSG